MHQRDRVFLSFMLVLIRHNFRLYIVREKSQRLLAQLQHIFLASEATNNRAEIVPYPILWEKVINDLSQIIAYASPVVKPNPLHSKEFCDEPGN